MEDKTGKVAVETDEVDERVPASAFDRFKEYEIVNQLYVAVQSRRQTAMNLFMSLNLAFLGAVGFLILSSKLTSWWAVGALGALSLAVSPVNWTWNGTMRRYEGVVTKYYVYLMQIEQEFQQSELGKRAKPEKIGVYLDQEGVISSPKGYVPGPQSTLRHERWLARYFLFLYLLITLAVAGLTYLVTNHVIPPFTLI